MALSKPLSGQLSIDIDTDPVSPIVEHRYRPPFSLGRSLVSQDALAGPEGLYQVYKGNWAKDCMFFFFCRAYSQISDV